MTLHYAKGSPDTEITEDDCRAALELVFAKLGDPRRVLALPPDYTRIDSQAGMLTCLAQQLLGDRLDCVLPALGTHDPMADKQLASMFPTVPKNLIKDHLWRTEVSELGRVPASFVTEATEGAYTKDWPVEVNDLIAARKHDLILSIGQVVPHEVIGMANYNKNLFVGTGGEKGINESHYIGALYGMERMMGVADTPLRRILNYAQDNFCADWPLLYVLTVVGNKEGGGLAIRGLYIGDDAECFYKASELSVKVNFKVLPKAPKKFVVYLDEEKFHSTWLGNKAIYRTRLAVADGGEVVILAPGVSMFGEDRKIDRLVYKYGYRPKEEIKQAVADNEDLRENLGAAAHLIHGSPENKFRVTYCPGKLSKPEIEAVGYEYGKLDEMLALYDPANLRPGPNEVNGEEIYYVPKPALGLWASEDRVPR